MCLIPEVNFAVDGEHGLMAYLKRLLAEKGHCVICVAEGAGQVLLLIFLCPPCPPPPPLPPLLSSINVIVREMTPPMALMLGAASCMDHEQC